MRLPRVVAVAAPAVAASALAVLPLSAASAAAPRPDVSVHRVSPAAGAPLAYWYEGNVQAAGATYSCQLPTAAVGCYTPQQEAKAYDVPKNLNGAGQTIAIIDAFGDPEVAADLGVFDAAFGLPPANLHILYPSGKPVFDPNNADEVNWSGEIALDVESAHAIAPAARIDLVIAKSDQDPNIEAAEQFVVQHHLGSVLSQSYGEAESCVTPSVLRGENAMYARAAAHGMTVFASSADDGAALPTCNGASFFKSVSYPASDPFVTAVGGTHLKANLAGDYEGETAWNDQFGSSGGGFSTMFPEPAFQVGTHSNPGRGVPDVSYSGDVNGGLLIAWSQGDPKQVGEIWIFGGTSAGSPQWAAITALANQAAHHPVGYLNPALYAIGRSPLYHYVFHDVTTGNNTVTIGGITIHGYYAHAGWDAVTGLGSPDVTHLISVLAH